MVQRTNPFRGSESSRATILEAATQVFARRGFAGTTMQEISNESGIKKPLIYHHFGSKEGLYSAVKTSIVGRLPHQMPNGARTTEVSDDQPLEVRRLFDLIHDHELLFRINAWAYLEGDSGLWPEVIELVLELRRRIERAQQQESIRWNIDLETLSIMLIGLVSFGPQIRARIASDCGRGPDYVRQLIALTIEGQVSQP